jgi:hypothetical protein
MSGAATGQDGTAAAVVDTSGMVAAAVVMS